MKYLDSCVFLSAAFDSGQKGIHSRALIKKVEDGEPTAISALTIDEVCWALLNNRKDRKKAIDYAESLFKLADLQITSVTRSDAYQSLAAMRKYPHLRPRDAIHLAVAMRLGAEAIISDDKDFDGIKELRRERV
jgi:predicted nucleic acid-binding protein